MSYLIYSFSMIVCSGLFLLLYRLVISRKADYTFCRRYLLVTMLLSVIIPTLNVPLYHKEFKRAQAPVESTASAVITETAPSQSAISPSGILADAKSAITQTLEPTVSVPEFDSIDENRFDNWPLVFLLVYIAGVVICLGVTVHSLFLISGYKKNARLTLMPSFTLAENSKVKSPFTFLGTVYIAQDYTERERSQILNHELSHVHHHHSYEKMAMALLRSIFWFNPFMWVASTCLEEVQEWQADNEVMSKGYSFEEYSATIIRQLFGLSPLATTGMSKFVTKSRLLRMKQNESKGHLLAVSALSVALTSALFLCFGCKHIIVSDLQNDDNRELPGQPPFIKTEGDYRKYVGEDDRMFVNINSLIYAKKGGELKRTFFEEKLDEFDELERGIEIVERPWMDSFPTMICLNGYKCADFPTSQELRWVNNKTIIVIGTRLANVNEFRKLKPEDYLAIVYYRPQSNPRRIPSLVYVITTESIDYTTNYNFTALINTPDADLPEVMSPGGYGTHGNYFICSSRQFNISISEHFAIDGKLVSFEEFQDCYKSRKRYNPLVLRNSQAERRFGPGILEVAELRSGGTVRVHFSNVNGFLMAVINGKEYTVSELKNLSRILGISPEVKENDPLTYVEIMFDQQNSSWLTDNMVNNLKQYIPWDDPALIIDAFCITTRESKPVAQYGFNRVTRRELITVTK